MKSKTKPSAPPACSFMTHRQVINEQAGGAEGTTWKLVVGQETQRALGKQGEAHISGTQTTSKSQTPRLLLWHSAKSRADEVVNCTSVL